MVPRLKAMYRKDIVPALTEAFSYTNPHQVPGLVKVVVNTGVGEAARDSKVIEGAVARPHSDHRSEARRNLGAQVHRSVQVARGYAHRCSRDASWKPGMWEFVDRLVNLALPRIRDFRGLSAPSVRWQRKLHLRYHRADRCSTRLTQDNIDRVRGMRHHYRDDREDGR